MTEYTLETFAEHVRQKTGRLGAHLMRELGPEHPASITVVELCHVAAGIVTGAQMREEQAEVSHLDLSLLPPPTFAGEDD
jgi:hypothetical protein